MILTICGHSYRFEMENICRLFFPQEKITVEEADAPAETAAGGVLAETAVFPDKEGARLFAAVTMDGTRRTAEERLVLVPNAPDAEHEEERRLGVLLYRLLSEACGVTMPWGAVTGVRPVKMLRHMAERMGEEEARRWMERELLVRPDKAALCSRTLREENAILALSRPESFSLYISIPFCPSRCDYCSFVSHTVERAAKLIPPYVDRLCEEIAATGTIARGLGLRLETIYMGGGTPTTLSAEQLTRIFRTVEKSFDLSVLREYTVEAGRPDTVTEDRLRAIRAAGVGRISINPQTLRDEVLSAIGRRHTAAQFEDAYALAVRCGFANINTDLIAGLPGDDPAGFEYTLDGILEKSPASVTVHTLAMKRASNLVVSRRADFEGALDCARMVDSSIRRLSEAGYHPYYLYRQSRTLGGTENTGWAKPGREGLYNVFIMDETHTILACGAGAVTKLRQPGGPYIERVFNYKFPYEYNSRFGDMLERKGRVTAFYEAKVSPAQP